MAKFHAFLPKNKKYAICCQYAAHMQQQAAAAVLQYEGPYLPVILIANNPQLQSFMPFCPKNQKICNVLQIAKQANDAATWLFLHVEPLTFQGTYLLSTIQNPRRLVLKYGFHKICCISAILQHNFCLDEHLIPSLLLHKNTSLPQFLCFV